MKKYIAHIVPSLVIGGVEVAVYKSYETLNDEVEFRVFYVRRKGALECNQEPIWKLFYDLLSKGRRPDVVITSLWWAHPFGIILQLLGSKWVAFFHSNGYAHFLDRLILNFAWRKSTHRIVDSFATRQVMNLLKKKNSSLVPYVFPTTRYTEPWELRIFDFVWVGRADSVKRIDLLITFLNRVEKHYDECKALVIVAGEIPANLLNFVQYSRVSIEIKKNVSNDEVILGLCSAKFYLLFSDREGMSMSTVEAVQSGCIPVVRRVGEIPNYLSESSCISIKDDSLESVENAVDRVYKIANDPSSAKTIQNNAYNSILKIPNYTKSLLDAVKKLTC